MGAGKIILIIIVILVLLGIAGFFMGFFRGGAFSMGAPYFPGPGAEQNMDGSVTYETNEGTVTVGGGSMPANWPSDAPPAYSGAEILYSGTANPTTGSQGSVVTYTTSASLESVMEYYESRLTAEGWTIEGTMNAQGMTAISAKKDTRTLGVYLGSAEGKTQVTAGVEFGE
jgi:hypothetical protein